MFFTKFNAFRAVNFIFIIILSANIASGQALETDNEGFEIFNYDDGDTTITMKKYFICFLKTGPDRNQSEAEAAEIQTGHLAHMDRLADQNKICIAGPFGDDGDIRGVVIYNVKTMEEAVKLTQQDPAVIAGRLTIEIHPWWAMKGAKLY